MARCDMSETKPGHHGEHKADNSTVNGVSRCERSQTELSHRHCRNYAPLDAGKGLCLVRKDLILADGLICEQFSSLPRCSRCAHYQPEKGKPQIGICRRSPNFFMAYADMTAKTCADFQTLD